MRRFLRVSMGWIRDSTAYAVFYKLEIIGRWEIREQQGVSEGQF
jgi:hypothetical protein